MDLESGSLDELVLQARDVTRTDDPEAALAAWQLVRVRFPDHAEGVIEVARALRRMHRLTEAAAVLAEGVERFPDHESVHTEQGWTFCELGDWPAAILAWRGVRTRFSSNPSGYHGGGLASREAGDFDEADSIYRAAFIRLPLNVAILRDFAWNARRRGDLPEALHRWQMLRTVFPDNVHGYLDACAVLSDSKHFEAADAIIAEAVRRFPESQQVLLSYAWIAHNRRDWAESLKRWELVITRCPGLPEGPHRAGEALVELGRVRDAATVLAPARRLFPDNRNIAVINGWVATWSGDLPAAEHLWADVRTRFPDDTAGWVGMASAFMTAGRLDEANSILVEALTCFPADLRVAVELARVAQELKNWDLATQRWRHVATQFPDHARGHIGLCDALIASGSLDEANDLYRMAIERFANDPEVLFAHARVAERQKDWPEAERRWTTAMHHHAQIAAGYAGMGKTLREAGHLDRSLQHLKNALHRFPADVELEIQLALTLSRQRNWVSALPLWESLKRRHPGHGGVRGGINDVLWHARQDQGIGQLDESANIDSFVIPQSLLTNDTAEAEDTQALRALLMKFESLGDTCEFGIVQRRFGAEPLSLLRWASISPENLLAALNARFEGVGDPEQTIVAVAHGEYTTRDRRYHIFSHTFTPASSETLDHFSRQQYKRMKYLRGKLINDLENPEKVFVYMSKIDIDDAKLDEVYRCISGFSKEASLLCVMLQNEEHLSGTLRRVKDRLLVGYIDKFSTVNISVDVWLRLCRETIAVLSNTN